MTETKNEWIICKGNRVKLDEVKMPWLTPTQRAWRCPMCGCVTFEDSALEAKDAAVRAILLGEEA
jgi:hypothetical protein